MFKKSKETSVEVVNRLMKTSVNAKIKEAACGRWPETNHEEKDISNKNEAFILIHPHNGNFKTACDYSDHQKK